MPRRAARAAARERAPRGPIRAVPPGYVLHRVGSTALVLDRGREEELVHLRLADPATRARLFGRGPRRGRGRTPSVAIGREESVVLRRYRHGGLLGRLAGSLFLGPGRALAELEVTARAEAAGAPVPHALCLVVWPRVGPLWSGLIGTREESGARDLLDALLLCASARERARLARSAGAAIRKLHDAGVEHGDLQLRNVLVRAEPGGDAAALSARRIVVVDLDGARFGRAGPLDARRRAKNLGRFVRSAVKTGIWPERAGRRELAALLAGYTDGDRALRRALSGYAARERARLALHRLGYYLWG
jgi:3-deoxy-D-manno-octulosonic acid kinase